MLSFGQGGQIGFTSLSDNSINLGEKQIQYPTPLEQPEMKGIPVQVFADFPQTPTILYPSQNQLI